MSAWVRPRVAGSHTSDSLRLTAEREPRATLLADLISSDAELNGAESSELILGLKVDDCNCSETWLGDKPPCPVHDKDKTLG